MSSAVGTWSGGGGRGGLFGTGSEGRGVGGGSVGRWLAAAVAVGVVGGGGWRGVEAAACTDSKTCCNLVIPTLPLTTTKIDKDVCSEGSCRLYIYSPLLRESL